MRTRYLVLIALLMPGFALADDWDDFTNNLATDLAPLISLFGEQVTKQFLSESLNILDNYIFALAPLGILTAVVSVIRVCGNSSLRAFIGRAHEGPGEAEHSLLSCVSETTAELFNDGGISRVFGRPKILEVVTWEDDGPRDPDKPRLTTLHGALEKGIWKGESANAGLKYPDFDIPNLSLNKGIKRRSQFWFNSAALVGSILQIGTIVFAAITVFTFPQHFKKNGTAVANYAFPLFFVGTFLLCVGMFLCAFIIERSSIEYYYYPQKKSKIFWLQPGGQEVGDQVFGAFLGVREGADGRGTTELEYIKSLRNHDYRNKDTWLLVAVSLTMIGFICQFVGLRGLHSSITLVQLGSTMLMAVIRTSLRMERTDLDDNLLSSKERRLTSYNKQELDCFAFHIEKLKSFLVRAGPIDFPSRPRSSRASAMGEGQGRRILKTRAHLAVLTSADKKGRDSAWDDLPIRKVATDLKHAIEKTMELVSLWSDRRLNSYKFDITLESQSIESSESPVLEEYNIQLQKMEDGMRWQVDATELEAILGLWTWSLLNSEQCLAWEGPFYRLVGQNHQEARKEETDLLYHKWIFRQTEASMASAVAMPLSKGMFGCNVSLPHSTTTADVLVMVTENPLHVMAAQDIYVYFLNSAFRLLRQLGGEIGILPDSGDSFVAHSSRIDELVHCFEANHLGSREDALLCIVPALWRQDILPILPADSASIRRCVKRYVSEGEWTEAFSLLKWICERSEDKEFRRSASEFGYLCSRAMLSSDSNVRAEGFKHVSAALKCDIRSEYFQHLSNPRPSNWIWSGTKSPCWNTFSLQLGWLAWHIAKESGEQSILDDLMRLGVDEDCISGGAPGDNEGPESQIGRRGVLHWLTIVGENALDPEILGEPEKLCLDWLISHEHSSLLDWVMIRWTEIGTSYPPFLQQMLQLASQCQSDIALQIMRRHGADMNARTSVDEGGQTALIKRIEAKDDEAVLRLLQNGADPNEPVASNMTCLIYAAHEGHTQIVSMLLQYGAHIDAREHKTYYTALNAAAHNNHLAVVQLLVKEGAYIDPAGTTGMTPLQLAASRGHTEVAAFLIENGANINAKNEIGCTALMFAIQNYEILTASELLRRGCDVGAKDELGLTAFDYARKSRDKEYLALLQSAS